ncbi:armadillo-type protein [Coprinopsis sp. MPI-PUGE-AT-0042]|nr:armadillo-type protein [Coprinopsis sp. MPI-PUGE-AT-0042]
MKGLCKRKKRQQPKTDLEDSAGVPKIQTQGNPEPEGHHSLDDETRNADGGAHSDNSDFRDNANIWSLYLKEASDRAKTQSELWKTGLESLLLFAGLFAGVVSAFLLESRKKLRMDDQELLLSNIHNALRGLPEHDNDYQPTIDHLWINGLWFGSLLITLFSAIVGVLAKSWLVNYAPLATREESDDAYNRWKADESVKTWHMERVVTTIPLLVQLAFFLFAIGLAIQCFNDHQVLGRLVSAIVGFGIVAYLIVTTLPLFIPDRSFPFRTPLSEILLQLRKLFAWLWLHTGREELPFVLNAKKGDRHGVLATIWCKHLIKSSKQDYVDEAAAEAARKRVTNECLKKFADADMPKISLKRLEGCMTLDYHEDPKRNEIMANHLRALSHFIDYSDETNHQHETLTLTLRGSLDSGSPLGRWNFFPEPILPLAFSVRVPILLAFEQDVSSTEIAEQPWEQLARSLLIQPKYRLRFILASCRALTSGGENLRKMGALSIASCVALAMKSGFKSEWSGVAEARKKEALSIVQSCIIRLCNEIASSWKEDALNYWKTYSNTGAVSEIGQDVARIGYPQSLRAAIVSPQPKYRHQAIRIMLSTRGVQEGPHNDLSDEFLSTLIHMAVFDKDDSVRGAAAKAVSDLGMIGKRDDTLIIRELSQLFDASPQRTRQQVIDLVQSLTCNGLASTGVLKVVIIGLIGMAVGASDTRPAEEALASTQSRAKELLETLYTRPEWADHFEDAIRNHIIDYLDDDKAWARRLKGLQILNWFLSSCLVNDSERSELLAGPLSKNVAELLVARLVACAMNDNDEDVRSVGRDTVKVLLETKHFISLHEAVLQQLNTTIDKALSSSNWWIRLDGIRLLRQHLHEPKFQGIMRDGLPSISRLSFSDSDDDVQLEAITLMEELVANAKLTAAVVETLPMDSDQYLRFWSFHQMKLITLLKSIVASTTSWANQGMKHIFHITLHSGYMSVCDAGLEAVLSLSKSKDLVEVVRATFPETINVVLDMEHEQPSLRWKRALLYLVRNEGLRDYCCALLQPSADNKLLDPGEEDTEVEQVCSVLAAFACMKDLEPSSRKVAMETLHILFDEQDVEIARTRFEDLASNLLREPSSETPLDYLKILTRAAAKYDFAGVLPSLYAILTGGSGATGVELRWQSLEALEVLGRRSKSVTEAIIKALRPHVASISMAPWDTRLKCAKTLGILAKSGDFLDGITQLVAMSTEDKDEDVRRAALNSLAELAGRPENSQADTILQETDLGDHMARIATISDWQDRMAWARTLSAISVNASNFDLGRQKLMDLVVEDDDEDVRNEAYKGLRSLVETPKLQDKINTALANSFKKALRGSDTQDRALQNLSEDCLGMRVEFDFNEALKPLTGPLLTIALDDEDNLIQDAAETFLKSLMSRWQKNTAVGSSILSAVLSSIASLDEEGKLLVLGLVEAAPSGVPDDGWSTFTQAVVQLLKSDHGRTRATALEILGILYKKGE